VLEKGRAQGVICSELPRATVSWVIDAFANVSHEPMVSGDIASVEIQEIMPTMFG
jgi:hypothetical protein